MASGTSGTIARQVDRLFGEGTVAGLSEGQLLERFVSRRDEAAFEALVARHGPMVLGLCRRILRDRHEAEDAFQATFLLLARKAGAIRSRDLVGPWLYRVAHRVALRASRSASRRIERERPDTDRAADAPDPSRPPIEPDLAPALHDELARLPERYRAPLVLCDLQGLTHEEAAARLRCPIGTVKGRLSRARSRLRDRLSIRGLVAPAGAVAACLAADARAAVPTPLLETTVKAAAPASAGKLAAGAVSATVLALAEGVAHSMLMNKMRWVGASALVAFGLLAAGVGATSLPGTPTPSDGPTKTVGEAEESSLSGTWEMLSVHTTIRDRRERLLISRAVETITIDAETGAIDHLALLSDQGTYQLVPSGRVRFEIRPSREGPDVIDFSFNGSKQPGLIRKTGNIIEISYNVTGSQRPVSLEGDREGELALVLRRVGEAEPKPRRPETGEQPEPAADDSGRPDQRGAPAASKSLEGTWIVDHVTGFNAGLPAEFEPEGFQVVATATTIGPLPAPQGLPFGRVDKLSPVRYRLGGTLTPGASVPIDFEAELRRGGMAKSQTIALGLCQLDGPHLRLSYRMGGNRPDSLEADEEGQITVVLNHTAPAGSPARNGEGKWPPVGPIDVPKAAPGITEEERDQLKQDLRTTKLNLELSENEHTHALERIAELRREGDRLKDQSSLAGDDEERERFRRLQEVNRNATQEAILELHKLAEFKLQLLEKIEDLEERLRAPSIEPRKLWPGDGLVVEVLEALPGRPITGERYVRPDGTISLGFYGDIAVAGLDRKQIKIKVIAHLRNFLTDEKLGLVMMSEDGFVTVPPVESTRVFVDELWVPPQADEDERIVELERRLDRVLSELEAMRRRVKEE